MLKACSEMFFFSLSVLSFGIAAVSLLSSKQNLVKWALCAAHSGSVVVLELLDLISEPHIQDSGMTQDIAVTDF